MLQCPKCKLMSPDDAESCDCGYRFPLSEVGKKLYENRLVSGNHVVISDFDMPFWQMVKFMVKVVFASIPAVLILAIFYVIITSILKT